MSKKSSSTATTTVNTKRSVDGVKCYKFFFIF
jgi:hypothetical protein